MLTAAYFSKLHLDKFDKWGYTTCQYAPPSVITNSFFYLSERHLKASLDIPRVITFPGAGVVHGTTEPEHPFHTLEDIDKVCIAWGVDPRKGETRSSPSYLQRVQDHARFGMSQVQAC